MSEIKTKKNSNRGRKALPIAKKQRHQVNSRLNDFEILQVDKLRGNVSRGEYLRRAAFNNAPQIIPEINLEAWSSLSRSASNLNQLAKNSHSISLEISEILEELAAFRLALIGAKL